MKYSPVVLGTLLIACNASRTPQFMRDELSSASLSPLPAIDAGSSTSNEAHAEMAALHCQEGMAFVEGEYCTQVEQKCLRWLDTDLDPKSNSGIGPLRCAEFENPAKCIGKRQHKKFCIDLYEWPNQKDALPKVSMDWYAAKKSCQDAGKRLCTANEWVFACEGESVKPYPYGDGYHRDDTACNIDKPSMDPTLPRSEWPKHYRAVPSGSMPMCVSPFGVYDMTGNVDEFVYNEGGRLDGDPYISGLKGGYWSKVRNRCRPMTTVHSPQHSFYQNGFRCCSDAK